MDLSEEKLYIQGTNQQIQESVIRVLENAIDAVSNTPHPVIELSTHIVNVDEVFRHKHTELQGDSFACIHIKDNGEGIPAKNMEHIFEPFFTTKDSVKGQGLGLSIAYGLIQHHGGTIDITSTIELGTSVHLHIPLQAKENP